MPQPQPYITTDEFKQLGIPSVAFAQMEPGDVQAIILACSELADSYLGPRYLLPLIKWGGDLKLQVAALVQYQLLSVKGFRPDSGNDNVATARYDRAIEWLERVSEGEQELAGAVDSSDSVDEEGTLTVSDGTRQNFSMQTRGRCGSED